MKLTATQINDALERVDEAERVLRREVAAAQSTCRHNTIAEAGYTESCPPMRICLHCGMTEDGWGSGYHVLLNKQEPLGVPGISRTLLYQLRQGVCINDIDKGPLIRRETTVQQMVADWLKENDE